MRRLTKSLLEKRWPRELVIFFILFILVTLNAGHKVKSMEDLAKDISYFLILYAHAQLHTLVLVPVFFAKEKYFLYLICAVLSVLLVSLILYWIDVNWFYYWLQVVKVSRLKLYFYHTGTCALSLIAMTAPFAMIKFYQEDKKQSANQLAMHQLELRNLRAQLNPHFLFNTFNNLYGISLNDPSRVPDLILQISKLMRYQLDSNSRELVALEDELAFIESYIELEEERVGQRCDIRYEYENDYPGVPYFIAPLLLISFIENAFKHGTDTLSAGFIHINIIVKSLALELKVVNSVPYTKNNNTFSMGTGIKNTVQRLNILYGGKYELTMGQIGEQYTVDLNLPLTIKKHAE